MKLDLPEPVFQGETVVVSAMRAAEDMRVHGMIVGLPAECLENQGSADIDAAIRKHPVKLCDFRDTPLGAGLTKGVVLKGQLFWAMRYGPATIKVAQQYIGDQQV